MSTSEACDFFVGEVRSYNGENDQIIDWYADQRAGDGKIGLLFFENGEVLTPDQAQLPNALTSLLHWELDPAQQNQPLYIVYIFLSG